MNKKRDLSTGVLVKRLAGLVKHLWLAYVLAISGAVLGFLATILIPSLIIKLAWQGLDGQIPSLSSLILLFVMGLLRGLFRYQEHYFGHYVAFKTLADFRRLVFQKLDRLTPAKLDRQDSGSLLKMIGEDIEALEVFFAHTLPPVATAIVVTFILIVYYLTVSPVIALIALLTYAILAIFLPKCFALRLQPLLKKQSQTRKAYMSRFSDSLRGMKELLQFGQSQKTFDTLNEESQMVNARERDVAVTQYLQTAVTFLVLGLAIMLVASLAFLQRLKGSLSLFSAVTVIVIFSTSFAPYLELSRLPLGFKRAMNAARQIFTLLDEEEVDKTGQIFDEPIKSLVLDKVTFAYDNRKQNIFDNLSLAFENHKIIGLVGPSGSGKSTLMKLIMRWYDVTGGQIRLNEKRLADLSAVDVQKRIAYIPQRPQLFSQTIRDNLTFGNPHLTDEMVLEAARKCRIEEKILASQDGLDTMLSSEQQIFSAGEVQRLELTRALLKDADCYIFDEPTSNLDSLNEASLLHVIREHCKGYVFLISHRRSTLSCSDVIYRVANQKLEQVDP